MSDLSLAIYVAAACQLSIAVIAIFRLSKVHDEQTYNDAKMPAYAAAVLAVLIITVAILTG